MDFKKILNIGIAIVGGWFLGSLVNIGIILLGLKIYPLPETINVMDIQNYNANAHLLTTTHYITPFLAHAIGTLVGAFFASRIAKNYKLLLAILIGLLFLIGGIMEVGQRVTPTWFIILDLVVAYIPMAFLGYLLGKKLSIYQRSQM